MNWNKKSVKLHKDNRGKIRITSKIKLKNTDDLSMAYSPGVAKPVELIIDNPKNAYIYTSKKRNVAIATNGTAVLGLGNTGALASIPVMEGKASIFKEFANIDGYPMPINEENPKKFINIITAISPYYNGINLEDIKAPDCFYILEQLQKKLDIPVFHDDQHGTAIVVLAALLNASKLAKLKKDTKIIISGAGSAGIAITNLLLEEGYTNITILDSKGIIHTKRTDINKYKKEAAKKTNSKQAGTLKTALTNAKVFIGVSIGNILTKKMMKTMQDEPIIFALANPTPEINPQKAKEAGASIIATGRSDYPNQINNALVFPGLFKGLIEKERTKLTLKDMTKVAKAIANMVNPTKEKLLPNMFDDVVDTVAKAIK